jgi:hypothetical protein
MKNYKFITTINKDGTITLPSTMQNLFTHEVEITLSEKESDLRNSSIELLEKITEKYNKTNEPEINILEIYSYRNQIDGRQISFD